MKKIYIIVFILVNFQIHAQDIARVGITNQTVIFLQNINIDSYNCIGFSNISYSQASEIGSANPASLSNFNSMSTGLLFQYNTPIDYYLDLSLERDKQWLPSSFGMVYPLNNISLGISYHQKYSSFLDYGKMAITTSQNPDGTGEFFESSSEIIIHSPSAIFTYTIGNVFKDEDRFSIGAQLYWDYWQQEEKIWKTTASIGVGDFSFKTGLLYKLNNTVSFGLLFEKGIYMEGELELSESNLIQIDPDTLGNNGIIATKINPKYRIELPDKLSCGMSTILKENVILSTTITSVFWHNINDNYKNQIEFSANTIFSCFNNLDLTLGIYLTDRESKDQEIFSYSSPNNASYFNIGARTKINNILMQFEIMDSHLISVDVREHTIFKFGINYEFNK